MVLSSLRQTIMTLEQASFRVNRDGFFLNAAATCSADQGTRPERLRRYVTRPILVMTDRA